jgi:50S ribosomal subunit-associated GTPase HflX
MFEGKTAYNNSVVKRKENQHDGVKKFNNARGVLVLNKVDLLEPNSALTRLRWLSRLLISHKQNETISYYRFMLSTYYRAVN